MTVRVGAVAALAGALAVTLLGCSTAPPVPPRAEPNSVERSAELAASAHSASTDVAGGSWIQLWTPNQAGGVIERCVAERSGGVLAIRMSAPAKSDGSLSFEYGMYGYGGSLDHLFGHQQTAAQLVDGCVAATPIDSRRLRVPARDRDALYSYDVTVLRRCLIEHGQAVPTAPDRAGYEALLRASEPWSPYDQVIVKNRAAWYALSDACPPLPASIAVDAAP